VSLPIATIALLTLGIRGCEWTERVFGNGTRCVEEAMAQRATSAKGRRAQQGDEGSGRSQAKITTGCLEAKVLSGGESNWDDVPLLVYLVVRPDLARPAGVQDGLALLIDLGPRLRDTASRAIQLTNYAIIVRRLLLNGTRTWSRLYPLPTQLSNHQHQLSVGQEKKPNWIARRSDQISHHPNSSHQMLQRRLDSAPSCCLPGGGIV
jgi:hypothetical protein